jgi:hypothetical protein
MVLLLRDTADFMPLLCVCVCLYWSEDLEGNLCLPSFLFSDAKTSTLSSDDDDILLLLLLRHYKLCPTSSNTHNEKLYNSTEISVKIKRENSLGFFFCAILCTKKGSEIEGGGVGRKPSF